jgi:manganese/zinc/iron transport system substrate-binding protein
LILLSAGCGEGEIADDGKLSVITSTAMIADLTRTVAGDLAVVETIIPSGVSPHLYKPTVKDIDRLRDADLVLYIGLGFEHQLAAMLDTLTDVHAVALGLAVPRTELIRPDTNTIDPHFWTDVSLWIPAADNIHTALAVVDSFNVITYTNNSSKMLDSLMALQLQIKKRTAELPQDKKYLVTTHDCLSYFARAYGFETMSVRDFTGAVPGVPGARAQEVADYVIENNVPVLFAEAGMPADDIAGVQEIVKERQQLQFGPDVVSPIYIDNVGKREARAYLSMMRHNVNTIISALSREH